MNNPGETDRDVKPRICVCGEIVPTIAGQAAEETSICPNCGTLITESVEEDSVAETQMINVREMARMAQDGLNRKDTIYLEAFEQGKSATKNDPEGDN